MSTTTEEANPTAGTPTVGVVVPAYRVERYVEATLRSVQAQTFEDWECVVVDDGSPDGTAEIVTKIMADDPRIRMVQQENRGLAGARNTGIEHLSPSVRFVAFLDSDDLWQPDMLEVLHAALGADPAAVGAYGYAEWVDEDGTPIEPGLHPGRQRNRQRMVGWRPRPAEPLDVVEFAELVVNNPVWPPAVGLHRREVIDRVGGFDAGLKQLEDLDYALRMSRHGHFRPTGQQVAWYRQHPGQMTKRRGEFWWFHDTVRRKTWESPLNTPEQRRVVVRAWRVAHGRRIARCAIRLTTSTLHRQWADTRRLGKGLAVLLAQATRSGPPVARMEHVVWAGRDV